MDLIKDNYSKLEVEYLLSKQTAESANALKAANAENARLVAKYDELRSTIIKITQKTKEVQESASVEFKHRLDKLKLFQIKFVKYYNLIMEKYPKDTNILELDEFLRKMDAVLATNYMDKKKKYNIYEGSKVLNEVVVEKVAINAPDEAEQLIPPVGGFNLDEALHPSEDLEQLCRQLGLI